jgi:pimeloyl-ACP methyl ester carboxylesterase
MAFAQIGGIRLYHEDSGAGLPAVVFLHGAGGNHLSWWQQVPAFREHYRCITVDQRGFGQSPDVANGPGPSALAGDLLALLDQLLIDRCALVAQSMGGWTAVGAVLREPKRFSAVVLANTVGNLTSDELHAHRKALLATKSARPPVLSEGALGATFRAREPVKSFLYAQIEALNPPRPADFGERLYGIRSPVDAYAACRVRTLFITSDEDVMIWPEISEAAQEKVPGSMLLRVKEAGHSTYFEQPDLFNREVLGFLR